MLKLSSSDNRKGLLNSIASWIRWHLPTRISSHSILSGPLRGKKIVTSWRDYPAAIAGITEPELLAWFSHEVNPGETWLDIGAHYGYTSLSLSHFVGQSGRVFAFEPMPATVGCLARTRAINNLPMLTVVPFALGADPGLGLVELNTVRGMVDSTLPTSSSTFTNQQWKEKIMVAQLDWLWPLISSGRNEIHGIKIDVQGMELHVLHGMKAILRTHRPKLVIELHRGVDRSAVLSILTELGYSVNATAIEPMPGESQAQFHDDRSYAFLADPIR